MPDMLKKENKKTFKLSKSYKISNREIVSMSPSDSKGLLDVFFSMSREAFSNGGYSDFCR